MDLFCKSTVWKWTDKFCHFLRDLIILFSPKLTNLRTFPKFVSNFLSVQNVKILWLSKRFSKTSFKLIFSDVELLFFYETFLKLANSTVETFSAHLHGSWHFFLEILRKVSFENKNFSQSKFWNLDFKETLKFILVVARLEKIFFKFILIIEAPNSWTLDGDYNILTVLQVLKFVK